jgi:hypothetical protein
MLKKTIIAVATTLVLATGSLAVSTGGALAWHRGEPHHSRQDHRGWDNGPRGGHGWNRGKRVCRPIVKQRKVWRHGRMEWRKVVVGERCFYQQRGHGGPRW